LENQHFQGFLFAIFLLFTPLGENLGKIVAYMCALRLSKRGYPAKHFLRINMSSLRSTFLC